MALLNEAPRECSAVAAEPTKVLAVAAADFEAMLAVVPGLRALFALGECEIAQRNLAENAAAAASGLGTPAMAPSAATANKSASWGVLNNKRRSKGRMSVVGLSQASGRALVVRSGTLVAAVHS